MPLNMPRSDDDMAIIEKIFWLMFNPPDGKIPNYDNPPSLAPLSFGLFPLLTVISLTSVTLRIWHNWRTTRRLKIDDYLIVAGVMFATAQVVLDLTGTKFARHSWDIRIEWLNEAYLKKLFSQQMVAWVSLLCTKLSILFLYLRIFEVNKSMKYAIIFGMIWTVLTYLPFLVITPLQCAPHIGEEWGMHMAVRCRNTVNVDAFIVSAVLAVMLDIYILVLPLPLLRHLSLSWRRKAGLVVVFMTASFALVCAVLNLVYRVKFIDEEDIFWMTWELIITAVVENNVAITIACVPAVTGLFKSCASGRRNKRAQLLHSTASKWTTRNSHNRSRGHVALKSIGGTPWDLETGSDRDYHMYSTTHLSGWKESKNGKLFTEVSNIPEIPEKSRLRQQHGITKVVGFEQRSSRGTIEEMELSKL